MTPFLSAGAHRLPAFVAAGALVLCAFAAEAQAPAGSASPAANPAPAAASIAASNGDDKITVNFVNADIQSVIKTVGQHTGRNFILDPRVTGTVNIVSKPCFGSVWTVVSAPALGPLCSRHAATSVAPFQRT